MESHDSAHCVGDGLVDVSAIGLAAAERIFFDGFTLLPSGADMCDARLATEAAAETLYGPASSELGSTTDAWVAVGLTDEECGLVAPAPNTAPSIDLGQSFSVDENSANGTDVGTVLANDPENDSLTYAIRNNFLSGLKVRDEGARTC